MTHKVRRCTWYPCPFRRTRTRSACRRRQTRTLCDTENLLVLVAIDTPAEPIPLPIYIDTEEWTREAATMLILGVFGRVVYADAFVFTPDQETVPRDHVGIADGCHGDSSARFVSRRGFKRLRRGDFLNPAAQCALLSRPRAGIHNAPRNPLKGDLLCKNRTNGPSNARSMELLLCVTRLYIHLDKQQQEKRILRKSTSMTPGFPGEQRATAKSGLPHCLLQVPRCHFSPALGGQQNKIASCLLSLEVL
jgi:hypothetical protein